MEIQDIIEMLHPLERKVLPTLKNNKTLQEIQAATKLEEIEVMRALQWLENKKILKIITQSKDLIEIDSLAKTYIEKGLPERNLINFLGNKEHLLKDIKLEEVTIALGLLKKNDLVKITKKDKDIIVSLSEKGKKYLHEKLPEEHLIEKLAKRILSPDDLVGNEKEALNNLKQRKNFVKTIEVKSKSIELTQLGKELISKNIHIPNLAESLTPEMIKDGSWKNKKFRRYDININVPKIAYGRRHFVNEAINSIKKTWLEMGFTEMSGSLIQTSFWNFDALFVPQDHPAREIQDTFFLEEKGNLPKEILVNKVKKQHEDKWKYTWNKEKAKDLVLRTHTTCLSAQTISDKNSGKFFSVGRCFRNETIDWSHLFEFNQCEGIVIGEEANFKNLIYYLKTFFKKIGYDKIRIKPSYFPYTEPSIQVEVFIKEKNIWLELGGAGILRPEVTLALMGKEVPVLAWGLGLERIITLHYNLTDIRDLYKNNLKQLREIKTWM